MEESWRDDEIEVCKILLELPQLIYESERPFIWGRKGRRSAIADSEVSCSPLVKEALVVPLAKETAAGPSKVEAASPATPLSFPPSEADDNLKRKKKVPKVPKQRKRGELLEIIDGLTKRGNLLRGEIQNVRNYYDKLRAKNLKLKAKKQELEQRKSLNLARELAEATFKTSILEPQLHLQQQQQPPPLMVDQTAHRSENGENHEHPYARFPSLLACSAQLGVPNLNISAQAFDLQMGNMQMSMAKAAAQARQKRIQINRAKNPIAAGKTRYTNR